MFKIKKSILVTLCIVFAILFISLLFISYSYFNDLYGQGKKLFGFDNKKIENICADCVRRLIDGVFVKSGQENLYPFAVMIENHSEARPSAGLAKANLVFEAEAEGGITRFLAVYASGENIEKIGPVRSVRSYFLDWAQGLSAVLAHCGGSPDALAKIALNPAYDLNEFYNGQYFWREASRAAPHNIYTSSELINKFLQNKKLETGVYLPWQFKDDSPISTASSSQISISFKPPYYLVEWRYNQARNDYSRLLAGSFHQDEDKQTVTAKNIIIMTIPAQVVDAELRLKMSDLGSGQAVVCQDGQCQEGSWRKEKSSSQLRFYNLASQEFQFNAGTTWIEVVRPEVEVKYK